VVRTLKDSVRNDLTICKNFLRKRQEWQLLVYAAATNQHYDVSPSPQAVAELTGVSVAAQRVACKKHGGLEFDFCYTINGPVYRLPWQLADPFSERLGVLAYYWRQFPRDVDCPEKFEWMCSDSYNLQDSLPGMSTINCGWFTGVEAVNSLKNHPWPKWKGYDDGKPLTVLRIRGQGSLRTFTKLSREDKEWVVIRNMAGLSGNSPVARAWRTLYTSLSV
jgi:hypothetical protein